MRRNRELGRGSATCIQSDEKTMVQDVVWGSKSQRLPPLPSAPFYVNLPRVHKEDAKLGDYCQPCELPIDISVKPIQQRLQRVQHPHRLRSSPQLWQCYQGKQISTKENTACSIYEILFFSTNAYRNERRQLYLPILRKEIEVLGSYGLFSAALSSVAHTGWKSDKKIMGAI